MMNIIKEKIKRGDRVINATLNLPNVSNKVLIIAPAMGVKQGFYKPIAEYFVTRYYTVITFDYFGMIHTSCNKNESSISLEDFGKKDIQEIILFAKKAFSGQPLFFLGHSVAGQVFPLAPAANDISAAYLVASQCVSKMHWSGKYKWLVCIFWYFIIPVLVRIYGFLPGFAYGGKFPLHKKVALDWARLAKSKKGVFGGVAGAQYLYKNLKVPSYFLSFENDNLLAPKKATQALMESYGSNEKIHEHYRDSNKEKPEVGHFDFFKRGNNDLWDMPEVWFQKYQTIKKST